MTTVPRNKGSYSQRKGGSFQVKYPLGWNESKKKYDEYREDVSSEDEAMAANPPKVPHGARATRRRRRPTGSPFPCSPRSLSLLNRSRVGWRTARSSPTASASTA